MLFVVPVTTVSLLHNGVRDTFAPEIVFPDWSLAKITVLICGVFGLIVMLDFDGSSWRDVHSVVPRNKYCFELTVLLVSEIAIIVLAVKSSHGLLIVVVVTPSTYGNVSVIV